MHRRNGNNRPIRYNTMNKHYLSIYYGIDETLPDDIFYQRVKEINKECEESTKKFTKKKGSKKLWQENLFQKTLYLIKMRKE